MHAVKVNNYVNDDGGYQSMTIEELQYILEQDKIKKQQIEKYEQKIQHFHNKLHIGKNASVFTTVDEYRSPDVAQRTYQYKKASLTTGGYIKENYIQNLLGNFMNVEKGQGNNNYTLTPKTLTGMANDSHFNELLESLKNENHFLGVNSNDLVKTKTQVYCIFELSMENTIKENKKNLLKQKTKDKITKILNDKIATKKAEEKKKHQELINETKKQFIEENKAIFTDYEKLKKLVKELQTKNQSLTNENGTLKTENNDLNAKTTSLQKYNKKLKDNNNILQNSIDKQAGEIAKWNNLSIEHGTLYSKEKKEKEQVLAELLNLQQEFEDLKNKNKTENDKIKKLRLEINGLKEDLEKQQINSNKTSSNHLKQIEELKKKNKEMEKALSDANKESEKAKEEIKNQLEEKDKQIKNKEEEIAKKQKEMEDKYQLEMKKKEEEMKQELATKQKEITKQKGKMMKQYQLEMAKQKEEHKKEIEELKSKYDIDKKNISNQAQISLDNLKQQIEELQKTNQELIQKNNTQQEEFEKKQEEMEKMEKVLKENETKFENQNKTIETIKLQNEQEKEEIKKQHQLEMEKQKEKMTNQHKEELENQKKIIEEKYKNEMKKQQENFKTKEEDMVKQKEEMENIKNKNDIEMNKKIEELENQKKTIEEKNKEMEKMEKVLKENENELQTLKNEIGKKKNNYNVVANNNFAISGADNPKEIKTNANNVDNVVENNIMLEEKSFNNDYMKNNNGNQSMIINKEKVLKNLNLNKNMDLQNEILDVYDGDEHDNHLEQEIVNNINTIQHTQVPTSTGVMNNTQVNNTQAGTQTKNTNTNTKNTPNVNQQTHPNTAADTVKSSQINTTATTTETNQPTQTPTQNTQTNVNTTTTKPNTTTTNDTNANEQQENNNFLFDKTDISNKNETELKKLLESKYYQLGKFTNELNTINNNFSQPYNEAEQQIIKTQNDKINNVQNDVKKIEAKIKELKNNKGQQQENVEQKQEEQKEEEKKADNVPFESDESTIQFSDNPFFDTNLIRNNKKFRDRLNSYDRPSDYSGSDYEDDGSKTNIEWITDSYFKRIDDDKNITNGERKEIYESIAVALDLDKNTPVDTIKEEFRKQDPVDQALILSSLEEDRPFLFLSEDEIIDRKKQNLQNYVQQNKDLLDSINDANEKNSDVFQKKIKDVKAMREFADAEKKRYEEQHPIWAFFKSLLGMPYTSEIEYYENLANATAQQSFTIYNSGSKNLGANTYQTMQNLTQDITDVSTLANQSREKTKQSSRGNYKASKKASTITQQLGNKLREQKKHSRLVNQTQDVIDDRRIQRALRDYQTKYEMTSIQCGHDRLDLNKTEHDAMIQRKKLNLTMNAGNTSMNSSLAPNKSKNASSVLTK